MRIKKVTDNKRVGLAMNFGRKMKVSLMAAVAVLSLSATSYAIPSLQLYSPDATYDDVSDTWIVNSNSFELWVVASTELYDVHILAALGEGNDPDDGSLDIGSDSYTGSDFVYGNPGLAPHGIYPAYYVDKGIGDFTSLTDNTIADFTNGYVHGVTPLNKRGQIKKYQVDFEGFTSVHFDAYGYEWARQGREYSWQFRFAPYSHDAEGGPGVPEPASMTLFGIGLAGLGAYRKFRK